MCFATSVYKKECFSFVKFVKMLIKLANKLANKLAKQQSQQAPKGCRLDERFQTNSSKIPSIYSFVNKTASGKGTASIALGK